MMSAISKALRASGSWLHALVNALASGHAPKAVAALVTFALFASMSLVSATTASAAAPEGTGNIAPFASVTSSVHDKGAIPNNFNANAILDGNAYNTGGAGSEQSWCTWYNGTSGGSEWLQLDWTSAVSMQAADLWFWSDGSGTLFPTGWSLQYSDDGTTWTNIQLAGDAGAGYPVTEEGASSAVFASPVTAKHLRANITQASGKYISVTEFKVYSDEMPVNVANESYATSSVDDKGAVGSNFDINGVYDGVKKNSGNGSADTWCTWYNGTSGGSESLQLNWFVPVKLEAVSLWFWSDGSSTVYPTGWSLQSSEDGVNWSDVPLADGNAYSVVTSGGSTVNFAAPITAKYLKANITQASGKYISVSEFEAYAPHDPAFISRAKLVKLWRTAHSKTEGSYTSESWQALVSALAAAETVLKNTDASADDIAQEYFLLKAALDGLTNIQVLEADFSADSSLGDFRGGANGTLYGFGAEGAPTDAIVSGAGVENTSQKPPKGQQHPTGDVIDIENQFINVGEGEDLCIYMQDFYPDWAYTGGSRPNDTRTYVTDPTDPAFGTYTEGGNGTWDYLEVVELVTRYVLENSDQLDHYVFIPFNEGDMGNWSGAYGYGDSIKDQFKIDWDNVYHEINDLYDEYKDAGKIDSNATPRIGGPGDSSYRPNRTKAFLEHAIKNDTVPDMIVWHELSEENIKSYKSHYDSYRSIEQSLASQYHIDLDLQVNISEWGELRDMSVAGQIIQWFSVFEDTKAQAQTAYWNYPGNLSDNASRANNANAAWWMFKWYSDLRVTDTANPVKTYKTTSYMSEADQASGTANTHQDKLAGIAALDMDNNKATILYGGAATASSNTADDTGKGISVKVDIKNIPPALRSKVDVEVREASYVAADGNSTAPRLVNSMKNVDISDGTLEVTTPSTDRYAGYQLVITPARDVDSSENPSSSRVLLEEEAENLDLANASGLNATVEQRKPTGSGWSHLMFSGNSHVINFGQGDTAAWDVSVPETADYRLQIISANDGFPGTIKVCVDGTDNCQDVSYEAEEATWSMALYGYRGGITQVLSLPAGAHTITIVNDGRVIELDKVQLYQITSESDGAGTDAEQYTASADFRLKDGAKLSYRHGTRGWADLGGGSAAIHASTWESGYQNLKITYSATAGTSFDVTVHGIKVATITVKSDGVQTATVSAPLSEGINEIDLSGDSGVLIESVLISRDAERDETKAIGFEAEDLTLKGSAKVVTNEEMAASDYAANGGAPQPSTASGQGYVTGLGTQFETYVYNSYGGDKTRLSKDSATNNPIVKPDEKGTLVIEAGKVPSGTYNVVFRYSNDNINPNNNPDIAATMDLGLQIRQDDEELARGGFRWTYTDSSFMNRAMTVTIDGSKDTVLGNWDEPGDLKAAVSWGGAPNIDSIEFYPMSAPVDSVTISGDGVSDGKLELTKDATADLTATVLPADADDSTVSWSSSDESVATVDADGKVTALKSGTATITATSNGDGQVSDSVELTVSAADTSASDTLVARRGNRFYFKYSLSGGDADTVVAYGKPGDQVLVGDWDGDGVDTLAVRRGNTYYIKNSLTGGRADVVVVYGKASDTVLVGDWNGDGKDSLAVRRGNTYYIKNSLAGGQADTVVAYGTASDQVLVGDWDGDGRDTLAVRRGKTYHFKNSLSGGQADTVIAYGHAYDKVLVGDWNGDGKDTLAVRRGKTYHFKNSLSGGDADTVIAYGWLYDQSFAGRWR